MTIFRDGRATTIWFERKTKTLDLAKPISSSYRSMQNSQQRLWGELYIQHPAFFWGSQLNKPSVQRWAQYQKFLAASVLGYFAMGTCDTAVSLFFFLKKLQQYHKTTAAPKAPSVVQKNCLTTNAQLCNCVPRPVKIV